MGDIPLAEEQMHFILPMALQYLCPMTVSILGLGAVSAAVMSSTDSSTLCTASVFTKNIYKSIIRKNVSTTINQKSKWRNIGKIIWVLRFIVFYSGYCYTHLTRKLNNHLSVFERIFTLLFPILFQASDREMVWVMRVATVAAGVLATIIAIIVKSVYGLFILCSDLMYVILFPQFICVLFISSCNTYGSFVGFVVAFTLRACSGAKLINFPALIHYPFYNQTDGQLFPFRTLIAVIGFFLTISVSVGTKLLFTRGWISMKYDIFDCFAPLQRSNTIEQPEAVEMLPESDRQKGNLQQQHM